MLNKMEKLKQFFYEISFKKEWSTKYNDTEIHAQIWWFFPWITGEIYSINGKIVQDKFHWLPKFFRMYSSQIENVGFCKILIFPRWSGCMGCRILIDDKFIGGDIDNSPEREFDLMDWFYDHWMELLLLILILFSICSKIFKERYDKFKLNNRIFLIAS